jgi:cellobiose phosphorylase
MGGVFHSMVTQGHVSINRFLSTCHSYLGLFRSHGQRVFVQQNGEWCQLGLPSAFEMNLDSCRWIYRHSGGLIEVISSAPDDQHELLLSVKVQEGDSCRFLITHHVAMNGDDGSSSVPVQYEMMGRDAFVRAIADSDVGRRFPEGGFLIGPDEATQIEAVGGDEWLFSDGVSRAQPFLCFVTAASRCVRLRIKGCLVEAAVKGADDFWGSITGGLQLAHLPESSQGPGVARAMEIFPWLVHNALIHYLSPRGLEQYSGGGWGTRDVCQGPVELLLALGRFEPVRDLLCRVFRQQNEDGDWPQWFMFFDRERNIRPRDSHGDIVYWPIVALAQYLSVTGDAGLLEEPLPYYFAEGDAEAETGSVSQHVERALAVIKDRVIAGTRLAAYGHGDWNDSLQPARSDMRERLCSSWTVTLNYQMLSTLSMAFQRLGNEARAAAFESQAASILEEFQTILIVDNVLSGLVYFHDNRQTEHLLHPSDHMTGLSYSLLPMVHAIINEMFTPAQAESHLTLIRYYLLGPDGAHLFDRPMAYHGGIQTYFQRAESASYFGREIGIMYTHAHLRYCEALARYGDAEAFFDALERINPIAIREVVTSAGIRQANCYYSSSDAAFADRYVAYETYEKVNRGEVTLEGGWRVYSSGAGIATRLIMQCFFGIVIEKDAFVFDPLIPSALNNMRVHLLLAACQVEISYRVQEHGRGPTAVLLNGVLLPFSREKNRYRTGAARVEREAFLSALTEDGNQLTIELE